MSRLDELMARIQWLQDAIGGAESDEQREELLSELRGIVDAVDDKIDAIGGVLLMLKRHEETCREEAAELKARAQKWERDYDRLVAHVVSIMEAKGYKKLVGPRVTLTRVSGRDHVVIDDLDALPTSLVKKTITVSTEQDDLAEEIAALADRRGAACSVVREGMKAAIAARMEHEEVPGASMGVGDATLRVYRAKAKD